MGGMNGHEFLRATVTADLIHWGVVGIVALVGWLLTQYIVRRRKAPPLPTVPLPTVPLPQQWIGPCPLCAHCRQVYSVAVAAPAPNQMYEIKQCTFCGNDARGVGIIIDGKRVPTCVTCCNKRAGA
jgi:hypothetical protein